MFAINMSGQVVNVAMENLRNMNFPGLTEGTKILRHCKR